MKGLTVKLDVLSMGTLQTSTATLVFWLTVWVEEVGTCANKLQLSIRICLSKLPSSGFHFHFIPCPTKVVISSDIAKFWLATILRPIVICSPVVLFIFTVQPVRPTEINCCKMEQHFPFKREPLGGIILSFLSFVPQCHMSTKWSKETYKFMKMEWSILVLPVKVVHLQRWTWIFQSEQAKTDLFT